MSMSCSTWIIAWTPIRLTSIMETLVSASRRIGVQAIIQVEHDMDIVFGYSDRIIALHEGRVLADGPPATIEADRRIVDTVIGRRARARRGPGPAARGRGRRVHPREPHPAA